MNRGRLPTKSSFLSGRPLTALPRTFFWMGMGRQTGSLRARGAARVTPGPEMGLSSGFSAKPGSRSGLPSAASGPATQAPTAVSMRQILPHPAHRVVPLKFQKGYGSRKFFVLQSGHVSNIGYLLVAPSDALLFFKFPHLFRA